MQTKEQRRASAIKRNAKYRAKYEAQCLAENPNASTEEVRVYADTKQGIPKVNNT